MYHINMDNNQNKNQTPSTPAQPKADKQGLNSTNKKIFPPSTSRSKPDPDQLGPRSKAGSPTPKPSQPAKQAKNQLQTDKVQTKADNKTDLAIDLKAGRIDPDFASNPISANPDDYKDASALDPKTNQDNNPKLKADADQVQNPAEEKPKIDDKIKAPIQPTSPFDVPVNDDQGMWGKTIPNKIDKQENKTKEKSTLEKNAGVSELDNNLKENLQVQAKSLLEENREEVKTPAISQKTEPKIEKSGLEAGDYQNLTDKLGGKLEAGQASSKPKEEGKKEDLISAIKNPPKRHKIPFGRILAVVIGLIIIFAGAWFWFKNFQKKSTPQPPAKPAALVPVAKKKNITLTYWGLWEPKNIIQPVLDKFEKETGIKVNYVQKSPDGYRLMLTNAIKNNQGPDIFRFHNTWLPMLKQQLSSAPADVYTSQTFSQTFYPIARKDLVSGQDIKGVPLEIDGLLLFYNKDLLSKAGLINNLPTNWDILAKQAQTLTVRDTKGKITTAGVALGTTNNIDHWSDILGLMFYQNGVVMSKLDTSIDSRGRNLAADAIRYYTHFVTSDNPVWSGDLPSSTVMFDSGRLAYYFGPSWRAFEFAQNNVNFGITNVPKIPGDDSEWASYWAGGVSIDSKHKQEAWQFLKFMTQAENLKLFFQQAKKSRLFGESYPRLDMNSNLAKDPYLAPVAKMAPNLKSYYFSSFTRDQGLNDQAIDYLGQIINKVLNNASPENALKEGSKKINQVLTNYQAPIKQPAN